jgi:omega-6 fatty acid desaturase (delta-12 desaturase)
MSNEINQSTPAADNRPAWLQAAAPYRRPHHGRSVAQIITTIGPYLMLWAGMVLLSKISIWLALLLTPIAAGFLVRAFIISHDCGHGGFFRSRRANTITGTITSLLVFTPYEQWRHEHAQHHATGGDLDNRGIGDIITMTVAEYANASKRVRFRYRLYRSPWVLFTIGPLIQFLFLQRVSRRKMSAREHWSIWQTNLMIAVMVTGLCLALGVKTYLVIQLTTMFIACSVGVWLFYVQHQFEGVYWARHNEWEFEKGAVDGSSFYKLPRVLQWITGSIGYHHIHHLSPGIPNYNLEKCYRENPMFQNVKHITLRSSLASLRFRLWDEEAGKLVGYDAADAYGKRLALSRSGS